MVKCSTLRQQECSGPTCHWVVGKGCRSLQKQVTNKSPIQSMPPRETSRIISFAKEVILFTGFRSEHLASLLKKKGASIATSVSKDVTLIVAKNKFTKTSSVQYAKDNGLKLLTWEELERELEKNQQNKACECATRSLPL